MTPEDEEAWLRRIGPEGIRRLLALSKQNSWSEDEWREMIRLSPPGNHRSFPIGSRLGVLNLKGWVSNLSILMGHRDAAVEAGFLLEAITATACLIELWLRAWLVEHHNKDVGI